MSKLFFLLLLLIIIITTTTISSSVADTDTFIFAGCSQSQYSPSSLYAANVNSLLASLVSSSTSSSYNKLTSASASPSAPVYGIYQCRGDVSVPDCGTCLRSTVSQLSPVCPSAVGATIQLDGCMMRYGNDSFVGKQDTNLLYKKCGPVPNNGYSFTS